MDSALRETSWKDLDGRIKEAEDTIARKRKLESMLGKIVKQRGTTPEHVYTKVRDEYRAQLDEVSAELDPLAADIAGARESVSYELRDLEHSIESDRDGLAELNLRFNVGEFDKKTFEEKEQQLKASLNEHDSRKISLMDALARFDSFSNMMKASADTDSESEPAEADDRMEPEPSPDQRCATPEPGEEKADEFVNPNEWLESLSAGGDDTPDAAGPEPASQGESALFEDLLDNTLEPHESVRIPEKTEPASTDPVSPDSTPLLVIKSKTGSEKRIPVLPITLTIGREHDNNVELKDKDAARYHARIVFKNGEYVLEALERSRSTLVNGKQVVEAVLQDADTITIGKTHMFFMVE